MTGPAEQSPGPAAAMVRLGARYHEVHYAADPIAATVDGVAGYDDELPIRAWPRTGASGGSGRDRDRTGRGRSGGLDGEDLLSHQTLTWLLRAR